MTPTQHADPTTGSPEMLRLYKETDMPLVKIELWLVVDAVGDFGCGCDEETARQAYTDNVGDLSDANGFRLVKMALTVPVPGLIELAGTIPEEGGDVALTIADPEQE